LSNFRPSFSREPSWRSMKSDTTVVQFGACMTALIIPCRGSPRWLEYQVPSSVPEGAHRALFVLNVASDNAHYRKQPKGRWSRMGELMSALGQKQTLDWRPLMSALPPKADMVQLGDDVRFVPQADIAKRVSYWGVVRPVWKMEQQMLRSNHAPVPLLERAVSKLLRNPQAFGRSLTVLPWRLKHETAALVRGTVKCAKSS
jgi:hypothetical protein